MTYIIYDTALNGTYTLMFLQNAYPNNQSLFTGTKDEILSDAAPYLFLVDELLYEKLNAPLVSLKELVVFRSGEQIKKLVPHFQHFIYEKINGQENYIRFWDARVLTKFFKTWPAEKTTLFFEDIECFYFVNKQTGKALRTELNRGKIQSIETGLAEIFVIADSDQAREEKKDSDKPAANAVKPVRKFFT
jgi:hypothetical protein